MGVPYRGSCSDVTILLKIESVCCESCHQDWDEGFDEPTDFTINGARYKLCCRLGTLIESLGGSISSWQDFDP